MKWLGQHMFEFDAHFLQTVYVGHEASGSAFIEVPNRLDGTGGALFITAGGAGGTNQTGGNLFLSAGGPTGNALGGNIYFSTWTNNGSSGDTFDADPVALNQDYQWTFGNNGYTAIPGDLRLPDDGVIETTGSLKFRLDYDQPGTDETDNSFSFLNYSTEIANLDDEGNLQIDGNLTPAGIVLDGNTITGIDDSGEFTDDDAHIMTSAAINDRIAAVAGSISVTDNSDNARYPFIFHDDSNNLLDDTDNFEYNPGKSTVYIESGETECSVISLKNFHNGATAPKIKFYSQRADDTSTVSQDGDDVGSLTFYSKNDAGGGSGTVESIGYAQILAEIEDASDSDEAGKLSLLVACSNGSNTDVLPVQQALVATGHGTNNTVDVGIGYGSTSTTTIAGGISIGGTASIPKRKFAAPSDGAGNADGDVVYIGSNSSAGGTPAVLTAGKIYYFHGGDDATNGSWTATNSNDPSTATGLIGVALGDTPATHGVLLRGTVDLADAIVGTEAMGSILYLDKATAGAATTAAPTATGDIVRVIGYAITTGDTNKIWFNPDNTWVEHV